MSVGSADAGVRCYHDSRLHLDVVILFPGHLYITSELEYISTVLGTCIAVCLYDQARCFGGMNHFMLPRQSDGVMAPGRNRHRYGEHAMRDLLEGMQARGALREDLCAMVFGGGRVNGDRHHIGVQNRDYAIAFLQALSIPVQVEHTGGKRGRQVLFDPRCGHARVRAIQQIPDQPEREAAIIRQALAPERVQDNQPLQNPPV